MDEYASLGPLERVGLGISHALMARAGSGSEAMFEEYPSEAPRPSVAAIFHALEQATPWSAVVLQGVPAELWAELAAAHAATRMAPNRTARRKSWRAWRKALCEVKARWLAAATA